MQRSLGRSKFPPNLFEVLGLLAAHCPNPMAAFEGSKRIVRYANASFCLFVGKAEADLLGHPFGEVVPEDTAHRFLSHIDGVLATGQPSRTRGQEPGPTVSGVPFSHWSLMLWPVHGRGKEATAVLVQVTDLTAFQDDAAGMNQGLFLSSLREHEYREAAEASNALLSREVAERQAAQSALQKLAEGLEVRVLERTAELQKVSEDLQGITYSIAHTLRAPLRAIDSTSKILLQETAGRLLPGDVHLLERQEFNALKVASLVDDLLECVGLSYQPIRSVTVDVTAAAKDLALRAGAAYPERRLNIVVQEGMSAIADRAKLAVVLSSLIDNAAKFSPEGGRITIGRNEGGAFYVRDEGIGFDMKFHSKLFQRFQRLVGDEEFAGNGIGLAKVKRIAEMHGGTAWAESAVGEGATFFFVLGDVGSTLDSGASRALP